MKVRVSAVFAFEQCFFKQYKKLIEGSSAKGRQDKFYKQISCIMSFLTFLQFSEIHLSGLIIRDPFSVVPSMMKKVVMFIYIVYKQKNAQPYFIDI